MCARSCLEMLAFVLSFRCRITLLTRLHWKFVHLQLCFDSATSSICFLSFFFLAQSTSNSETQIQLFCNRLFFFCFVSLLFIVQWCKSEWHWFSRELWSAWNNIISYLAKLNCQWFDSLRSGGRFTIKFHFSFAFSCTASVQFQLFDGTNNEYVHFDEQTK